MPLTLKRAKELAATAALATDTLPKLMNGRCLVIAEKVFVAMPTTAPSETVRYIALRWREPIRQDRRSHVAVFIEEGGSGCVVDASWQQYPFVASYTQNADRDLASDTALKVGDRVFVGHVPDWQDLVRRYNEAALGRISCRMFSTRDEAGEWMGFGD